MPLKPLEQLGKLAARIQNLPTSEEGARQLSDLLPEALSLLATLEGQSEARLALRCQVSRAGLQNQVQKYLEAFQKATDVREKVTRLTQARSEAHYLLWQVIRAGQR
jgi:hypothetical protein